MPEKRGRQLAAIMFADIVGFTALMQEDEDRACSQRDRQREVLSTLVPRHQGEILQYYGDGALSVFTSAVQAVECAVEIQLALREEPAVPLRIGVHTGDIVHEGGGVYGDGVNVAARIEGLAATGGVAVSGKVYDEIKNHPALSAVSLGPVHLKNVGHPVSVFAISSRDLPVPTKKEIREKSAAVSGRVIASSDPPWDWPSSLPEEATGPGETFLLRVKERAIIPWAVVYLLAAWTVLQTASFLAEHFHWSSAVPRGLGILTFVGFIVAMVVAWHHGEKGRQPVKASEVGIIAFLLVLGLASLFLVRTDEATDPGTPSPDSSAGRRPSIAVLPFDNFSPDPEDAYFANGVQEDVTTALSRIQALRVPGRSSVDRYKENRPSTQEMAAALGADYLLEGSATVVGKAVRVTVQLIDGRTDQHVWSEEYDYAFSVDQVISVRSALAREVASRLRALITPEEEARISEPPTQVPEALELYLRARYRWNQRTEAGVRESLRLFQEAIDLDPSFAEAYAGLADAFLVLSNWGWIDHREGHRRGIAAAERALDLDPLNASANASLGALHLWSTRDWVRSEAYFLRAIELDHEYAYTHYWYSALLSALGRHEESIHQAQEAEELDPLSPQISFGLSRSLFLARDYHQAIADASRALELHPQYSPLYGQICRSYTALGEYQEAEAACLREKETGGREWTLSMALVWAFQGNREAALRELEGIASDVGEAGLQPIIVAMVFAGLGDTDAAFERLQMAIDEDYPYLEYLPSNPFFDPLRSDPRFEALLGRIGL
jgi:class 3 adenylate cyclase/TolB-like protein/Tfp pilus assembly protein PilF